MNYVREEHKKGNFELYRKCLKKIILCSFRLDQTHHIHRLNIVLNDFENIPEDSNLYKEFDSRKFTVNSSVKSFFQSE